MTTDNTISVIIPVYNGALYLGQAIESVLAQTRSADEIIVVDDGSEDGSANLARSFGLSVRVLTLARAGGAAATNRGVSEARGRWLAFLDADDLWTERKLELQRNLAVAAGAPDMLLGHALNFHDDGRKEPAIPGFSKGTLFIERRRWLDVGPLDEGLTIGEFIDWFSRARDEGLTFAMSQEILLRRRIHATNSGVTSAHLRSQYALVAKRNLDRRRARIGAQPVISGPAKT